ncbi:hypothetical protein GS399_08895 [Pedobacter sp. HMF7647]|uniref:Polysaccharide deacetylase n=1 Tax=Hufsiella arboris TaxID=2695275 RepID=A0A7K1Y935_9SPHI|nr:hypothetical protein [Hufsiella arboris]MXV51085.1 hypothetical protein [Hufsiella arboris]
MNYKVYYARTESGGHELLILRKFESEGKTTFLAVDPVDLSTMVTEIPENRLQKLSWPQAKSHFSKTPFIKSLQLAGRQAIPLQNAGIDHAIPKEKGIALTVDLCPSHKPLDRLLFTDIFTEFRKIEEPAPVAVSVSGLWMIKHQDDLNWLKSLVQKKELEITWINHSYHHEVNRLPLSENFMLARNTDLDVEILENEKLMLTNGLVLRCSFVSRDWFPTSR